MIVVKKIAYWIAGLIILAVALVAVARHLLLGYLTPQNVVNQIESRWRCRAQIDSIDAHLMGHARIEIKGLALGPRDEYASRRTPLDQRPALELAELKSASVLLDVSLLHEGTEATVDYLIHYNCGALLNVSLDFRNSFNYIHD